MERRLVVLPRVRRPNFHLTAWLARTPVELARGLLWADRLGDREGMLFEMGSLTTQSFTMQSMRFPLDIVFMRATDAGLVPTEAANRVPVGSIVKPRLPYTHALEVRAGLLGARAVDLSQPFGVFEAER